MLGTFYAVELSREYISKYNIKNYVLDPVMVCKGAGEALNPELNTAPAAPIPRPSQPVLPAASLAGRTENPYSEEVRAA